jgi:bifunctional non-homologous end joining protein LigD
LRGLSGLARGLYESRVLSMFPGFVLPCLPKAQIPPTGGLWHEIKHDGFRIIARKDGDRVRLYTRNGHDFTHRFSLIVDAVATSCVRGPASSMARRCAVVRMACPASIASATAGMMPACSLYAFDLLELNGDDLRREALEVRKKTLASVLARAGAGLRLNDHLEHKDGEIVFRHEQRDSPYRSGRSPDWLKSKNAASVAAAREAEEDWYN